MIHRTSFVEGQASLRSARPGGPLRPPSPVQPCPVHSAVQCSAVWWGGTTKSYVLGFTCSGFPRILRIFLLDSVLALDLDLGLDSDLDLDLDLDLA